MVVGYNIGVGCAKASDYCTANFRQKDDGLLELLVNLPHFPFQIKQPIGQGFKLKFLLWFKLFFFFFYWQFTVHEFENCN